MENPSIANGDVSFSFNIHSVSYYGTRPLRCPPEAILHYASRDWPTDVTSAWRDSLLLHKFRRHVISSVFNLFSLLEAPLGQKL